jgi:hypothetical protein
MKKIYQTNIDIGIIPKGTMLKNSGDYQDVDYPRAQHLFFYNKDLSLLVEQGILKKEIYLTKDECLSLIEYVGNQSSEYHIHDISSWAKEHYNYFTDFLQKKEGLNGSE